TFQMRIGKQHDAATAVMTQKPGPNNRRRWRGLVSKKSPAEASHKTIVNLARMPRPRTKPNTGHAQDVCRKIARCPSTNAQPQQHEYGASMVISDAPACTTGSVSPTAPTPRPR